MISMATRFKIVFRLFCGNNGDICGIFIAMLCGYISFRRANEILVMAYSRVICFHVICDMTDMTVVFDVSSAYIGCFNVFRISTLSSINKYF